VDPRVAARLAELVDPAAVGDVSTALAILVHELCTTPIGVTAVREPVIAWERHVLDALRGVEAVDACPPGAIVDVGSGGGVPGLVLGLVRPDRPLHLVEATGRKARFIGETALRMGIQARVHAERSEDVAAEGAPLRDACACACARALATPAAATELCLPFVAPGGHALLWVGEHVDHDAVATAARELAAIPLASTADGLLVLEKQAATPARFPRRAGVAARRPLA
jgi:16S rRNA (guanine527-N7)-methyltransferase